jgi:hypothetical protein
MLRLGVELSILGLIPIMKLNLTTSQTVISICPFDQGHKLGSCSGPNKRVFSENPQLVPITISVVQACSSPLEISRFANESIQNNYCLAVDCQRGVK